MKMNFFSSGNPQHVYFDNIVHKRKKNHLKTNRHIKIEQTR